MWKKLEALMNPYENLADMSNVLLHIRQLIGALELHRQQGGDSARNAAIDAVVELLNREKSGS